jgi:hypothetical protein
MAVFRGMFTDAEGPVPDKVRAVLNNLFFLMTCNELERKKLLGLFLDYLTTL